MFWLCWIDYLTTMPKKPYNIPDDEPLAQLEKETLDHLDSVKAELDRAIGDLDALEDIGIDTSRLREKINWGYKAREVILKRFGPKE